jgi:hypothetical protein
MARRTIALTLLGLLLSRPFLVNAQQPITADLIACWEMDENGSVRYDDWNDYDLTDNNTVGSGTGHVNAVAADFVAANSESLTHAHDAVFNGSGGFTIAVWFYHNLDGNNRTMLSKWQNPAADRSYYIRKKGTGGEQMWFHTYDGSTETAVSPGVITATWSLIIAYYDPVAGEIGATLNNGAAATIAANAPQDNLINFAFGTGGPAGFLLWDDLIGPAAFWSRPLTTSEFTYLWNAGSGISCDQLTGGGGAGSYLVNLPSGRRGLLSLEVTAGEVAIAVVLLTIASFIFFELVSQRVRQTRASDT